MSEATSTEDSNASRPPAAGLAVSLFVIFVVLRLLLAEWQYFWEQDDISIAAGVAGMVRGADVGLYRYGPQLGYYRVLQGLDAVLGGDLSIVPHLMIGLSAISGALVSLLGFFAFRAELAYRTRLLLVFFLFANPILWTSSRYGNSAMPALAAVTSAVVILSNRPRGGRELAALALFVAAVLIRADSILVLPVIGLLLRRTHGSTGAAVARVASVTVALAGVYLAALLLDPRMDDVVTTTAVHLFNPEFRTQFWEYLVWSFSPLVLILAAWGWRDLLQRRGAILAVVTLWCVPVFAFYFGSTTTPRYALLAVMPVSICAVVGAEALSATLAGMTARRSISTGAVAVMAGAHLVVGLGQFTSSKPGNAFTDAVISTHDGPHPTGGFLWHGLSAMAKTLGRPQFGEGVPYAKAIEAWLASPGPARRIVYVADGEPSVAFRFHALVHGAKVVQRMPGSDDRMATWYRIGDVTVTWVDGYLALDAIETFDVGVGDEFWNMRESIPPREYLKFPKTLGMELAPSPGGGIHAYRFVPGRPGEPR